MSTQTVCRVNELAAGQMKSFSVDGVKVALYHLDDGFYATQASCTHMFAPLAKGKIIDGCQVQCPFHRARFDIRSGKVVEWANFPPGIQLLNVLRGETQLKTYPVRIDNGEVRITLP